MLRRQPLLSIESEPYVRNQLFKDPPPLPRGEASSGAPIASDPRPPPEPSGGAIVKACGLLALAVAVRATSRRQRGRVPVRRQPDGGGRPHTRQGPGRGSARPGQRAACGSARPAPSGGLQRREVTTCHHSGRGQCCRRVRQEQGRSWSPLPHQPGGHHIGADVRGELR
jgi:hypothetical protein